MPREVKESGKTATPKKTSAAKKAPPKNEEKAPVNKTRKAYPSVDERIALADKKIDYLTRVIDKRNKQIEQTEAKLNARKAALGKNTEILEMTMSRKERLQAAKDKPIKEQKPRQPKTKQKAKRAKARAKKEKVMKITVPKRTPEELKAFRVELIAKARAAKKAKGGI